MTSYNAVLSDNNNNWWPLTIFNEFHLCHDEPVVCTPALLPGPPSPVAAFMGAGVIENQLEAARISDPQPRVPPSPHRSKRLKGAPVHERHRRYLVFIVFFCRIDDCIACVWMTFPHARSRSHLAIVLLFCNLCSPAPCERNVRGVMGGWAGITLDSIERRDEPLEQLLSSLDT